MKLIVGLGNPGPEYNWTRHNFGFLALDFYAKTKGIEWGKPKFGALWAKDGDKILIKPQDFYNNSGIPVQAFAHFYKINPTEDLLVICDDFNLDFGQLRFRSKGSSGGNNGLKSISEHLGSTDFPRLRIGTGSPLRAKLGDVDFVLGRFTPEEKSALPPILGEITKFI